MGVSFGIGNRVWSGALSAISHRSPPLLFAFPPALPLYFEGLGVAMCMELWILWNVHELTAGLVYGAVMSFGRWRVWCLHALCVLVVLGCGADMCLPGRPPC